MENQLQWYNKTLREYISNDELKTLMQKSDWKAFLEIADTWFWIAFAFALPALYPNVLTVIVSLFILGGKQLACAIIMHDCSHDSLFTSRKLNAFVGNWLGGYAVLNNLEQYRPYHREHHTYTGLENDPDLNLVKGYPTTKISMFRKFLRDLSGATGIKSNIAVIAMHLQILSYNLGGVVKRLFLPWTKERVITSIKNLAGPLAFHLILLAILFTVGKPWLMLLWIGAQLTTYNFCLRVRSISEHSVVGEQTNPHKNSRTTYANFIERMLFAPHHVNFHAEHHLCMGIPPYNLPAMHKLLLERGFFKEGSLKPNYLEVVKMAVQY